MLQFLYALRYIFIKTYFERTARNGYKAYYSHAESLACLGEMPRALLARPHYQDEFTTSFGDPHFTDGL